jgi:hypothetical protein
MLAAIAMLAAITPIKNSTDPSPLSKFHPKICSIQSTTKTLRLLRINAFLQLGHDIDQPLPTWLAQPAILLSHWSADDLITGHLHVTFLSDAEAQGTVLGTSL